MRKSGREVAGVFFWDYFLGKSKCWKTYFRWISKTSQMLSKLSKNQQRNTQKPKFSRLRRSQEQKVIQMCLYLYLYYKIIFEWVIFWDYFLGKSGREAAGVFFWDFLGNSVFFWENSEFFWEFGVFFWDFFLGKFSFQKSRFFFGKIAKT